MYLAVNVGARPPALRAYHGREYERRFVVPLVLFSIPMAIATHTVTAFLYSGMAARPYWNASILAPRFLASAFCSGPAVMLMLFQVLRGRSTSRSSEEAIWKVAELMAYAMFVNLFLHGAELFKEFYSATEHSSRRSTSGAASGSTALAVRVVLSRRNVVAFVILLVPQTRKRLVTLNVGCLLVVGGRLLEKGTGSSSRHDPRHAR